MTKIIAKEYTKFLEQLKEQIATSRYKAALAVNSKLIVPSLQNNVASSGKTINLCRNRHRQHLNEIVYQQTQSLLLAQVKTSGVLNKPYASS